MFKESEAKRKKTEPAPTTKTTSVIAQVAKEHEQENNLFRHAISCLFKTMNVKLPFHMSELLRVIANYHRDLLPLSVVHADIVKHAMHLYEKAHVMEPAYTTPLDDKKKLLEYAPPSKYPALYQGEREKDRSARYKAENKKLGTENFFKDALDKYILGIDLSYGENTPALFAEILKNVLSSPPVQAMLQKHVSPEKRQYVTAAFKSAVDFYEAKKADLKATPTFKR